MTAHQTGGERCGASRPRDQILITLPVRDDINRGLRETLKGTGIPYLPVYGMSDLPRARSLLITRALRLGATVVVFIDADIVASSEQILALAHHARLSARSAVTGLYAVRSGQSWACDADPDKPAKDGCLPGRTAGLGFAAMTRASLMRVGKTLPDLEDVEAPGQTWKPYCLPYLRKRGRKHEYLSEDIALWCRLAATGTKMWADPKLTVGHLTQAAIYSPRDSGSPQHG